MMCESCGNIRHYKHGCDSRLCGVCSSRRSHVYTLKYMPLLRKYLSQTNYSTRIRFITITIKNLPEYDPRQIRHWFSLLRRRFKNDMISGLYCIETTNIGNDWHVHIHCICLSTYIQKHDLMNNWMDITGGSWKVDIVEAKSIYGLKSYLLGYVSKKMKFSCEEHALYFLEQSKHQKLIQTFGSMYGFFVGKFKLACSVCGCEHWITEYDNYDCEGCSSGYGFAHQKCQGGNLSTACAVDFQRIMTNWS